jgi:hypothetical protein
MKIVREALQKTISVELELLKQLGSGVLKEVAMKI